MTDVRARRVIRPQTVSTQTPVSNRCTGQPALTHLPRSPSAPHPRARPNNGAQINALRAQPDAQPVGRKCPRHQLR
jgi:hypothetical protein